MKKVDYKAFAGAMLALLLAACSPPPEFSTSFYYWRTTFHLSAEETALLQGTTSGRLYVRLFDVNKDPLRGMPVPVAPITGLHKHLLPKGITVVPVVFVVNRALSGLSPAQARALGNNIARMAATRMDSIGQPMTELQLDCDWSGSTREAFFALVEGCKSGGKAVVTSTIRLHQVRDFKQTGVPPVARGMLMCYNMGDVGSTSETNSILRPSIARTYLANMDAYPLPLDVALPLFGWGVEERFGKPTRILDQVELPDLLDTAHFSLVTPGRFRATQSQYLHGTYVYRDAVIRYEYASPDSLHALMEVLSPHLEAMEGRHEIALYHLHPGIDEACWEAIQSGTSITALVPNGFPARSSQAR